jgi:hypothetical protein
MTEMPDREKVIKGLSICLPETEADSEKTCEECPYWVCGDTVAVPARLIGDIRALLKAQEPVAPIFDYDGRDGWLGGNCHRKIFHPTRTDEDEKEKNYRRFCFHCGRAVKWE